MAPESLINSETNPSGGAGFWLTRYSFIAAWLGLLLAVFTPPHGTGITVCWINALTGIPCPGCGLTRSLSCALRGMPGESWHYHPLGIMILLMLIAIALVSLSPANIKQAVRTFIDGRRRLFDSIYWSFVIVFVGFGVMRALLSIAGGRL